MALISVYVDPTVPAGGSGSSGDPYGSMIEAHADALITYGDLVGDQNQIQFLVRSGLDQQSSELDFNGWTSNATYNIRVLPDTGHDHLGVRGAGYHVTSTFHNSTWRFSDFVDCEGITVSNTFDSTFQAYGITLGIEEYNIKRIIFDRAKTSPFYSAGNNAFTIESCLFSNTDGIIVNSCANLTSYARMTMRNCTGGKASANGLLVGSLVITRNAYNSVFYDCGTDFHPRANGNYNASSDDTAPGANSQLNIPETSFTDFPNDDYTIRDTGSALYDTGDAGNMAALDITGQPFTTNDIGCYRFDAAGPPDLALDQTMPGIATALSWNIEFQADLDLPLAGTLPGIGSVDWDVGISLELSATLPGAATVNWDLFEEGAQDFPLAATLAGIGTADWQAGIESTIAATWLGASSQDWSVATELSLATTLSAAATIDWNAALELPLATTLAGAGTIDWSIEGEDGLVAQLNGVATALDWDLGWEALLANTLPGAATVNWTLIHDVPGDEALIGTFPGVATTPAWSAIPELPLAASLPGVGTADAWALSLDSDLTLATTLAGIGTAVGWSAGLEQTLAATLPGIGTQDWNLSGDETLAVTLQGFATPDWFGSLDFPLFVTLPGITTVDDWSISRGGLDIPIFATAVRDVTPWPTVVDL